MKKSNDPFKNFRISWADISPSPPPKPRKPLKEYRIRFEKVPKGTKAVPDAKKLGARSKSGGDPDWIQYPQIPKCRDCKESMTFVAQLDSINNDETYSFGDAGMIYVFMCFDCLTTKSIVQYH